MKKFNIVIAIGLATANLAGAFSPLTANAVSPADAVIEQGDMRVLAPNCELDGSTTLASEASKDPTFKGYMDNAFDAGKGWSVSQYMYDGGRSTALYFTVSTNPENAKVRYNPNFYPGGYFYQESTVQFEIGCPVDSNGNPTLTKFYNMSVGDRAIAYIQDPLEQAMRPVFVNLEIYYPPNYEGLRPSDTYIPPAQKKTIRPNIVADVNDKAISIKSKLNEELRAKTEYKIYWFISNISIDGEGTQNQFTQEGYSEPEGYLQFTVPEYDDYQVNAYFVKTDGSPLQEFDDLLLKNTGINLNVNGNIYSIDSDDLKCGQGNNDENFCDTPINEFVPEQCDWYNPFTWAGCFRNGLHYMGEALGINKTNTNPTGSPFVAFTTNSFGLASIITAPLGIFNNLANANYTCNPISLQLPYVNRNIQLPCLGAFYTNYLGSLFNIYQTIIGGLVSYYVLTRMLELVKGFKDPQNDKIEVTKL